MEKLWQEIKDEVSFEKDIYVEPENSDSEGYCLVHITNGKYKGFSVVGRMFYRKNYSELIIDDDAVVYK